jgi:hypothetical protein
VKSHCPDVPVVVAFLDRAAAGRDVLNVARAGAEHFAFDQIDDVDAVLRALVSPGPEAPGQRSRRIDEVGLARARATARRSGQLVRYAERTPAAAQSVLPPSTSPLLRRIIQACLGSSAPRDVAALARQVGLPRRSLVRETVRRNWPRPHALLQWGRLFRGAMTAAQARLDGADWTETQNAIARAAGYRSVRTASRAYRARAGIALRDLWRDGAMALVPAFLAVTDTAVPPDRLSA